MSRVNSFSHVASFEKLLGICNNIGARYNPGNASITPTALGALLEQAQQRSKAVTDAQSAYTLAVNTRKEVFDLLPPFVAKLVRSAIAHGASAENTRDLKLLKKKFYPVVKTKKPPATAAKDQVGEGTQSTLIRYQTFDTRLAHFSSIVSIVESMKNFKPNESAMTEEGLKVTLLALKAAMAGVTKAANDLITARINRDEAFYGDHGIYSTSKLIKEYVRSVTGIQSQTALAVGKVQFRAKRI